MNRVKTSVLGRYSRGLRWYSSGGLKFATKYVAIAENELVEEAQEPLIPHLRRRGLVGQVTDETLLTEKLASEQVGLYCGADPTANSLHLGNLLPLMVLIHFNLRGHNVYGLVGGATGIVGDPSGKTKLRDKIADEIRLHNVARIQEQLNTFLHRGHEIAVSRNVKLQATSKGEIVNVNNLEWLKDVKLIDFLADFGSLIRISSMLARDSVKSRLESVLGLGFNEFTYQILQAFDFRHLFKHHNVSVQVGGNDQYGNITLGIDLISKLEGKPAFGLTVPLLTTSTGEKFGKSAGNAVFIDKQLTLPFQLYQYFINSTDDDVKNLLYKFSFLPTGVIDRIIEVHGKDKKQRIAQKLLAIEMCDLIHGNGTGYDNMIISEFLFNKSMDIPVDDILEAFSKQQMLIQVQREEISDLNILELLLHLDRESFSKSQLKRFITSGAVQVGLDSERPTQIEVGVDLDNCLVENKLLFVRVGKNKHYVVRVY